MSECPANGYLISVYKKAEKPLRLQGFRGGHVSEKVDADKRLELKFKAKSSSPLKVDCD